jgi:hypothetical protein
MVMNSSKISALGFVDLSVVTGSLLPLSASFLLDLLLNPQDGSDILP